MGDEGVGVGAGIDAISTRLAIGIVSNRLFDLRDQLFRFRTVNGHHLARHVGIPVGIRRITIVADRRAPAHLVITVIARGTRLFQHDPGVAGDGAFETAGHGGKDVDGGFAVAGRRRQHAGGRPSCGVPAARMVFHGPQPGRCQRGKQIDNGNRQQQTFCKFHEQPRASKNQLRYQPHEIRIF